jgi:hypothetical protein
MKEVLVATGNFKDPEITLTLVALSIIGLLITMPMVLRIGENGVDETQRNREGEC